MLPLTSREKVEKLGKKCFA